MSDSMHAKAECNSTPMTAEEITSMKYLDEMTGEEAARYGGEWIAVYDGRVVAHGKDPSMVLVEARRAGAESPFMHYIYGSPSEVPYYYTGS